MVVIAVVFPLALLLSAVLTQLAGSGALRRNRIAGIRIASTLSSDTAWVAGHKAAAPWVWAGFAVSGAAGIGAVLLDSPIAALLCAVVVIVLIATIALALSLAARAARAATGTVTPRR